MSSVNANATERRGILTGCECASVGEDAEHVELWVVAPEEDGPEAAPVGHVIVNVQPRSRRSLDLEYMKRNCPVLITTAPSKVCKLQCAC